MSAHTWQSEVFWPFLGPQTVTLLSFFASKKKDAPSLSLLEEGLKEVYRYGEKDSGTIL